MRKLLVLLVAAAFVFTMALPAMAADEKTVTLYGSARMETFIQDFDKDVTGTFDDKDLVWRLDSSSSRFGARFKAGDIGANVEIRPNSASDMRHWYGTWDFGSGTLLLGQTWTPSFMPICDECMIGGGGFLGGYGDLSGIVRQGMFMATFPMKALNGNLILAALTPTSQTPATIGIPLPSTDTDSTIPRLEAGFTWAAGAINGKVIAGYGSFDVVDTTNKDYSIDSYFLAANATGSFGPFWLTLSGAFGQNMLDYGYAGSVLNAGYSALSGDIKDVDQTRFGGEVGFKLSDKVSLFFNYVMMNEERDSLTTAGTSDEDDKSAMSVGSLITIAKGFTMQPEIVITDEGNRTTAGVEGADRGSKTYYGIYWQIDF